MNKNKLIMGVVIVIVIASLIFYFVVPALVLNKINPVSTVEKAKNYRDAAFASEITGALNQYKLEYSKYPWESISTFIPPTSLTGITKSNISPIINELSDKSFIKSSEVTEGKYNNLFIYVNNSTPYVCVKQLNKESSKTIIDNLSNNGKKVSLPNENFICFNK